jgi:hypothetical protein
MAAPQRIYWRSFIPFIGRASLMNRLILGCERCLLTNSGPLRTSIKNVRYEVCASRMGFGL